MILPESLPHLSIDASVSGGANAPFLLAWSLRNGGASLRADALQAMLEETCELARGGKLSHADQAVQTYRAELQRLGRNPNRYRISSEALLRRAGRDGAVPTIAPLVDLNNVVSMRTGWPIGCYDLAKIEGPVRLRLGGAGEAMSTLGKGEFDITALPVLADDRGPFGSPVSDSARCAVDETTQAALFVLYGYGRPDGDALGAGVLRACGGCGLEVLAAPALFTR